MECLIILCGTVDGALAYQNDPWMQATPSGNPSFKRCEQHDQHQLKAFASKMRAELRTAGGAVQQVSNYTENGSKNIPNIDKNVHDTICGLGDNIRNNFQHIPDTE